MIFPDIMRDSQQNFYCNLYLYLMDKSLLYIEVLHENKTFYVCFQDTLYFTGFRSWKTKGFEKLSDERCISLLNVAGYGTGLVTTTQMVTLGDYKLVQAKQVSPKVQIICQYINYYSHDEMRELGKLN